MALFKKNEDPAENKQTQAAPVVDDSLDVGTAEDVEAMMKKYDLTDILDKVYRKTDKYGECFVYVVPYKKAINRLLK